LRTYTGLLLLEPALLVLQEEKYIRIAQAGKTGIRNVHNFALIRSRLRAKLVLLLVFVVKLLHILKNSGGLSLAIDNRKEACDAHADYHIS
jgi:hypothetical protein